MDEIVVVDGGSSGISRGDLQLDQGPVSLVYLAGSRVYKELESCIRLTVSSSRCFTLNKFIALVRKPIMVAFSLTSAALAVSFAAAASAQTFQRLGTCPTLGCILPPDAQDFLAGQYFDIRVEIHAPVNGSEATDGMHHSPEPTLVILRATASRCAIDPLRAHADKLNRQARRRLFSNHRKAWRRRCTRRRILRCRGT